MRDCPKCSKPVDGLSCAFCGWVDPTSPAVAVPAIAPIHERAHLRCSDVFKGQRCAELGSLSEGTKGEGPWWCAKHFPPFAGRSWTRKPSPPPRGFQPLKDVLRKIDPESAAERTATQQESA